VRSVLDGQDMTESPSIGSQPRTNAEGAADNACMDASTAGDKPLPELSGVDAATSHLSGLELQQPGTGSEQATPNLCVEKSSPQRVSSPVASLMDSDFQTQPGNMRPQATRGSKLTKPLSAGMLCTSQAFYI
jgi:hypothetical protein